MLDAKIHQKEKEEKKWKERKAIVTNIFVLVFV